MQFQRAMDEFLPAVLPAPFGPRRAYNSPVLTLRFIPIVLLRNRNRS
nr:hypothetical protein [Evansella halocellulosilytica]